jgi:hypothetical protein
MPRDREHLMDGKKGKKTFEHQIHLKVSREMGERLEETASTLETDVTHLIRTILAECLPIFEERARKAKGEGPPEIG